MPRLPVPASRPNLSERLEERFAAMSLRLLRVAGVVTGVTAFLAAGLALIATADAGALLAAAGGLGALAFGTVQVYALVDAREAAAMRARATARLARRSLVEMINQVEGVLLAFWVASIGSSKSLDPIQSFLRELIDLTAPVGGGRAAAAERALAAFLYASDYINGLHSRLPAVRDFGAKDLASKGRILGGLIATVDALVDVAPETAEERSIKPKVRAQAMSIEEFFGGALEQ
jgi:hypothetical protein